MLWHSSTQADVARAQSVDVERGLPASEAARRLAEVGPNELVRPRDEPWWEELLESLREPLQLLLLAVAVIYGILGELADALTILAVIVAVSSVEAFNELRAKRAIRSLASLAAPTAMVVRDGGPAEIPARDVVPGDIVLLAPGLRVPADLRLLKTAALQVDESTLTGESMPVAKAAEAAVPAAAELGDRCTMAYAGTLVTAGKGRGITVATGPATELGRIAGLVAEAHEPRTPLQQAMRQLSGWLVWVAIGFSVGVPLLGVFAAGLPLQTMLLTGLTLAFATIPEELPILITIVLGLGAYRLAQRHAIVRRLSAVETLGSVTVVATDKTGTLTANRLTVAEVIAGDSALPLASLGQNESSRRLLEIGALANDAEVIGSGAHQELVGDPTDVALLTAAQGAGIDIEMLRDSSPAVHEFPFDDRRKRISVVCERGSYRFLAAKGAPESVFDVCSQQATDTGPVPFDGPARAAMQTRLDEMAKRGIRVLAMATRDLGDSQASSIEALEQGLTLLGLVGLEDPPRAEAAESVRILTTAGVRVLMVTGDHPDTARAIAGRVGIPNERVVLGRELEHLPEAATAELAKTTSVFARIAPEHKMLIVRGLQAQGELVAVTGDGVNDAPALREAAIGVAMGHSGTDVAREAADLVLADDNLATVTEAVRTGRTVFANLSKAVRYYLAAKVALVFASLVAVLLHLPVPFEPVQIIVMELFMDVGASAAFTAEPPEGDAMRRPPRDPRRPFMDGAMQFGIIFGGLSLGVAVLAVYLVAWSTEGNQMAAQTAAFVSWMIGHVVLAAHMRSERQSALAGNPLANRAYLIWAAAAIGVVLLGSVPLVMQRLHLTTLSAPVWFMAIGAAVLVPSLWEVPKWLTRHHKPGSRAGVG